MSKARDFLARFVRDEAGGTAIEYGLIALIVGLGIINSLQAIPPALDAIWGNVTTNLN